MRNIEIWKTYFCNLLEQNVTSPSDEICGFQQSGAYCLHLLVYLPYALKQTDVENKHKVNSKFFNLVTSTTRSVERNSGKQPGSRH